MSPEMLAYLCEFSYMDLPGALLPRLARGPFPLRDACEALSKNPPCTGVSAFAAKALARLEETQLQILGYVNQNPTTGFAAYSFLAPDGSVILAMRGSESSVCVQSLVDWTDNFSAPLVGSLQYRDVYSLVNRYPRGPLTITGHSKGGHNALYALAVAKNPEARTVAFNGQGFAREQLTQAQKARLQSDAVNYVTSDDIVGALIYHPEKRVFCAVRPGQNAHALSAFIFDADGQPEPAERSPLSRATEIVSRILLARLRNLHSSGTIKTVDTEETSEVSP